MLSHISFHTVRHIADQSVVIVCLKKQLILNCLKQVVSNCSLCRFV